MSTKIYDAYKLNTSDTSLNSLMVISNEIKQEVEQTAKTQTLPNIAVLIQYIWDTYTFYGEDAYNHINDGENDISEEKIASVPIENNNRTFNRVMIKAYEKDRYDFMPSVHDFDVSSY